MTTPIYEQTVRDTHIDPAVFPLVRMQPFTLYGFKKRKRLARDTTRVLTNEGFRP